MEDQIHNIYYRAIPFFDVKKITCLLRIPRVLPQDLSLRQYAEAHGFQEKDEFHITIIGFKKGLFIKNRLERMPDDLRMRKENEIKALSLPNEFRMLPDVYRISKEYVFRGANSGPAKKEMRESIIQLAEVKDFENFYYALENIIDAKFDPPFAHATLYTKGDGDGARMGIGIDSQKEFEVCGPQKLGF